MHKQKVLSVYTLRSTLPKHKSTGEFHSLPNLNRSVLNVQGRQLLRLTWTGIFYYYSYAKTEGRLRTDFFLLWFTSTITAMATFRAGRKSPCATACVHKKSQPMQSQTETKEKKKIKKKTNKLWPHWLISCVQNSVLASKSTIIADLCPWESSREQFFQRFIWFSL